ncbi:MAG: Trm112 family protein [Acidobacteria bacterium]|nr:Trm112 family protein [Acidobacteriota bacterium]
MALDPRLLAILCCPADHENAPCRGDLEEREDGLLCGKCGRLYPIEEGIPVMLVDRAVGTR